MLYFSFVFIHISERILSSFFLTENTDKKPFLNCAAHGTFRFFELCLICLREGLGCSKPATNPSFGVIAAIR